MKKDDALEPTLTDLMVAMKEGFLAMDGRLNGHDGLLTTLVARADTTDARIGDIQTKMVKMEKHLVDMDDKLDTLIEVVDKDSLTLVQHEERIMALEANVA